MAYDESLAKRLQNYFEGRPDVKELKMFGGLCFMVSNHMCCGIMGDALMARVGPDNYEKCLNKKHAQEMKFTGRAMKGMIHVSPEGIASDSQLKYWLSTCESFVKSQPQKKPKKPKIKP